MTAPATEEPVLPGRLGRLISLTRRTPSPRTQRVLLIAAAVVFVVGGWYALQSLDISWDEVRWQPIVIAAVLGVPLTLLGNTVEYLVSAEILRHRVAFLPALRLTILSTAANLLPIPGGFLVRVQGLRSMGSRYGTALGATTVVGLAWIGVSALLAGFLLLFSRSWLAAAVLSGAGVVVLMGAHVWLRRTVEAGRRRRIATITVAVELYAVAIDAARLWLVLEGLNIDATLPQTLVLAVSSSLAAAAGILPGGFGVRELIAAVLAPLVGLTASAGFAATALNRVMGIIVLAPVTVALALGPRHRDDTTEAVAAEQEDGVSG